jgi:hypothetical protein
VAHQAKKAKTASHPNTQPILEAYVEALGYTPGHYPQEVKAAKQLAQAGCEPAEVVAAYDLLKQQPFWQIKHLSLQTLIKEIPAIKQALLKGQTHQGQRRQDHASYRHYGQGLGGAADEPEFDPKLARRIREHRARLKAEGNLCYPGARPPAKPSTEPPAQSVPPFPLQGDEPALRGQWIGSGDLENERVGEGDQSRSALRDAPAAANRRQETNDPASARPSGQGASAQRGEAGWADAPPPDPKLQRRIDEYRARRKTEGSRYYRRGGSHEGWGSHEGEGTHKGYPYAFAPGGS